MKIWIICQYAGSPTIGMNYRPYYFGREFSRVGHAVTIISGSYSHQYQELPSVRSRYTKSVVDGLDYLWIRTPEYGSSQDPRRILGWLSFASGLRGLVRQGLDAPDVIIVSSPVPYPVFTAKGLSKRFQAALVFEERDLWPISLRLLGGHPSWHPLLLLTSAAQRYGVRKADAVVSPLAGALKHYRELGLSPRRFECISNGVDPSEGQAKRLPSEIERELTQPKGSVKLLYAGSFHSRNSAGVFANAMRILADRGSSAIMYFMGKDGGGLGLLKDAVRGLDNVRFLDPIPRSSMPLALSRVDICCAATKDSPLYKYGISLTKLYDYMAAGKPIVLSTSAEGDPVSAHGCGIKVPAENPSAIADAIQKLEALGESGLTDMGIKGRVALTERYTYARLASRYLVLLEEVVKRRDEKYSLHAHKIKG